jgi:WD40 repeat protein
MDPVDLLESKKSHDMINGALNSDSVNEAGLGTLESATPDIVPSSPRVLNARSPFLLLERISALDHGVDGDTYEKNPIMSISVHPEESSLVATGGHEGSVKLWSVQLPSNVDPCSKDIGRISIKHLNSLVGHSGQVNTVRFSPQSGSYLASCSSDSSIRVYSRESKWKLVHSLRGHTLDVTDIAWFNSTGLLVSCSTDGKVILWDVVTGGRLQTVSSEKGSAPKGLLVDPYRDYFCVLHDESLVDIYRRQPGGTFRHSRHIDLGEDDPKNFSKSTKTTVYPRRGSWDPLKKSVVLPLGSRVPKSIGPCGVFYDRANLLEPTPNEKLVSRKILAGHPARVVISTCMPSVREDDSFITALASVDGVISFWLSSQPQPLAVVANALGHLGVFTDSAWLDSSTLLLSSSDGAVTALTLNNIGNLKKIVPDNSRPSVIPIMHSATAVAQTAVGGDIKTAQVETRVGGKRKIQPVIETSITNDLVNNLSVAQIDTPTILPELTSVFESSIVEVKNSTDSSTLTCMLGEETVWHFSTEFVATCVSHNDEFVLVGLVNIKSGDASVCVLNAKTGVNEGMYIQFPQYVEKIVLKPTGTAVILVGKSDSIAVWSIKRESGQKRIDAIVPDAVLTGLFKTDQIIDIDESQGVPYVTLASKRRAAYHVGIRRWIIVG